MHPKADTKWQLPSCPAHEFSEGHLIACSCLFVFLPLLLLSNMVGRVVSICLSALMICKMAKKITVNFFTFSNSGIHFRMQFRTRRSGRQCKAKERNINRTAQGARNPSIFKHMQYRQNASTSCCEG